MELKNLQISTLGCLPTPRKKLSITCCTHLLKFNYEWLPVRKTLLHIDSTASPKCPSCNFPIETHNHLFRCPNIQWWQITNDCIPQIDHINKKWKVSAQLRTIIQTQLVSWITENQTPFTEQIATNPNYTEATKSQAHIGGVICSRDSAQLNSKKWSTYNTTNHSMHLNNYGGLVKSSNVCGIPNQSTGSNRTVKNMQQQPTPRSTNTCWQLLVTLMQHELQKDVPSLCKTN
jgi:hypothetical protein